jgi:uncharacterized protein YkwD
VQRSIRFLLGTALIITTMLCLGASVASAENLGGPEPSLLIAIEPTEMEIALFNLCNQDRMRAGLSELRFDVDALAIARTRAASQPSDGALTHYSTDGSMAFADLLSGSGIGFQLAGENLARIPGPISAAPVRAETSLMNSPSHRANILEPSYDLLAVGAVIDVQGRVVFAQVFRSDD